MDAGRATSTEQVYDGAWRHAGRGNAGAERPGKRSGNGAPPPATELVKKWALLMSTAATMGTGSGVGTGAAATGGAIGGAANVST